MSLVIGAGNEHDGRRFTDVLEGIRTKTGRRPRTRPHEVVADAAYDEGKIRRYLRRRGYGVPSRPTGVTVVEEGDGEGPRDSTSARTGREVVWSVSSAGARRGSGG